MNLKAMRFSLAAILALGLCRAAVAAPPAESREAYDDFYCTTCHGADGRGNYGVQAPKLAGMEPWYLQRQLEKFRAGLRGTTLDDPAGLEMRAMAEKLSDASIAKLVDWVGQWPDVATAHTVEGDAAAGKALFTSCAACHGAQGQGNQQLGAPALAGQSDWYLLTQLQNFSHGYRGADPKDSEGQAMRAAVAVLPDEQAMRNVVSYINQFQRSAPVAARTTNTKE